MNFRKRQRVAQGEMINRLNLKRNNQLGDVDIDSRKKYYTTKNHGLRV
jgi:hypothetical protein